MRINRSRSLVTAAAVAFTCWSLNAGAQDSSNAATNEVLLLDNLGQVVKVPTNKMPAKLLPPPSVGVKQQIPTPTEGASQPDAISQRSREAVVGFRFLPSVPPPLAPYLASQDEFGNTAARPGPLFPVFPLEPLVQRPKYWLSDRGFRYTLQQTLTFANMTGVKEGDNQLGFYTLDLKAVWAVYDSDKNGTAGWISGQLQAKSGLGHAGQEQDAQRNIGSITDPTGIWSSINGIRVPQLAWQQAVHDGEFVAIAGMVKQDRYIDRNAYAQSGRAQFLNSALINSEVMPLPQYNFGLNLQWQPLKEWYGMFGASAGNNKAGLPPWTDFNLKTWTLLWELGYAPEDVFGLGPGVYRIQPFVATRDSSTGGGLCFNLQQKLGRNSPFGWYGRFGFGDRDVSAGAATQIGTGFVAQGPLRHWLLSRTSNDLLGVGFVWSQPSETTKTVYHQNEYAVEVFHSVQLTPTVRVKPDFQFVTNPAYNPDHDHAIVFQLQLELAW